MKDKLEEYINEHSEDFDMFEPSPEIWAKIKKRKRTDNLRNMEWKGAFLKIAAAIVIFIGAYYFSKFVNSTDSEQMAEVKVETSNEIMIPEVREAENYYSTKVNNKLHEIENHLTIDSELKKDIKYDISELDSIYLELKDDLKDGIASQEVVDAMVQNYRMKLKILEDLLEQFDKADKNKNNNKDNHNGKQPYRM